MVFLFCSFPMISICVQPVCNRERKAGKNLISFSFSSKGNLRACRLGNSHNFFNKASAPPCTFFVRGGALLPNVGRPLLPHLVFDFIPQFRICSISISAYGAAVLLIFIITSFSLEPIVKSDSFGVLSQCIKKTKRLTTVPYDLAK